jgi:hypothetical protein
MTQLEIEEAIREAWLIVQAGAPPSARRLVAVIGGHAGPSALGDPR